jgi:hypothetical protein
VPLTRDDFLDYAVRSGGGATVATDDGFPGVDSVIDPVHNRPVT